MAARRVVVVDVHYPGYEVERRVLAPFGAEVEHVTAHGDAARIREAVREADAVLVREAPLPATTIEGMERCRVIVRYGVGVDNIDLEAARRRRIFVANVPDYGADEVAEHAAALLLAVWRRVARRDRDVRAGRWGLSPQEKMYRLRGRTLGIVGFGRIGRRFFETMRGFGFGRVLVYDPVVRPGREEGVEWAELDELCRQSDVVSLHAPLGAGTRHLIDARRLSLMKPTAILVNTARGGLVEEAALVAALKEGRLFGAGLDVFEQEPLPASHPLRSLDNVVLSDHTAWYSEESLAELQRKAAEEVAEVFAGRPPRSWVNPW